MRKLLWIQAAVTLALAGGLGARAGSGAVLAAGLYGALIALANTRLLAFRMARAAALPADDAQAALRLAWTSALERFALVALLFAVGLGPLALAPRPLLVVFAAGQLTYLIAGLRYGNRGSCQART
ncbi:MAG: hypothetical protein D6721_05355 [Gammaproteobacteria bacterium]|nr:MAG: hypothetical protein D6721_05355 [Gammaproteobacteria bacterium]